jgi:hypothetical protein
MLRLPNEEDGMEARLPRSARIALLAVGFVVLGALTASAAQANDWKLIQTIDNKSPYEMRLVSFTTTELTKVTRSPDAKIAPGGADQMRADNDTPGHGVAMVATYDLYAVKPGPDVYKGMVLVRSGIDCEWWAQIQRLPTCLDYTRWNRADVDSGGAVRVTWWNNGGNPNAGFYTQTDVLGPGQQGSTGAQIDPDAEPPDGSTPEAEPSPNGLAWNAVMQVHNETRYEMRQRASWNSEYSSYDPGFPGSIAPGADGNGTIGNSKLIHGPQSVVMWDLIDPATKQYRASVVTVGGVECTVFAAVVGCVGHNNRGEAYAGGSGRVRADASLTTDGSPAHLYIEYTFKQTSVPVGGRDGEVRRKVRDDPGDDDELDDDRGGEQR